MSKSILIVWAPGHCRLTGSELIIMVIYECYFSIEHIALSSKNGVNIELGKPTDLDDFA